jgi:hypothetical protein
MAAFWYLSSDDDRQVVGKETHVHQVLAYVGTKAECQHKEQRKNREGDALPYGRDR